MINKLWHEHFHIVPGISPRPISALQLRCRAWYRSLGLIPVPIWKMSCNNLLLSAIKMYSWQYIYKYFNKSLVKYIYNIDVLTVNIELIWRGIYTGERRALASLSTRFGRTTCILYLPSMHQYYIYPAIKFAKRKNKSYSIKKKSEKKRETNGYLIGMRSNDYICDMVNI